MIGRAGCHPGRVFQRAASAGLIRSLALATAAFFLVTPAPVLAAPMPDAQALLDGVVARLPQEPLLIAGDLVVRKPRGLVTQTLRFEMRLEWGRIPARAQYTIRDSFGAELEQLTLVRHEGGRLIVQYAHGSPLVEAPPPPLDNPIQNSDLSWSDLTLAFLWWPGAVLEGEDTIRNRPCYVVEVPAPPSAATTSVDRACASVALWVDRDLSMLLQAEARDAEGDPIRTLWVKSFKKTNERWMIKDMEVQRYPLTHRTRLRVERFTDIKDSAPTAEDSVADPLPPDSEVMP
jgi:hypothetical protein